MIRNLGDKVLVEGTIVGVEELDSGAVAYKVAVPDYYCSWVGALEETDPDKILIPEEEIKNK